MQVDEMIVIFQFVRMVITEKNATVRVDTAPSRMIVSMKMEPVLKDVNQAITATYAEMVRMSTQNTKTIST